MNPGIFQAAKEKKMKDSYHLLIEGETVIMQKSKQLTKRYYQDAKEHRV